MDPKHSYKGVNLSKEQVAKFEAAKKAIEAMTGITLSNSQTIVFLSQFYLNKHNESAK